MSTYEKIAKGLASGKFGEVDLPTENIDRRRLTVDEIKTLVHEEFGKAKDVCDVKAKELEKGWGDAEIAKEIEWVKTLDLKEYFDKERE